MGFSPYVVGGVASGVGQGIREGVGTIVARRKEEEERRRQRAREEREDRRLDQQDARIAAQDAKAREAYDRQIFGEDIDFTARGGVIEDDPTDNGTASIGMYVGVSTASTQPSEHHQGVPMREVGRHGGKVYKVPADGLTPEQRRLAQEKQGARKSRAEAARGFKFYKPTPADLAALETDQDDTYFNKIAERDWALNPENVAAQARVAGARAGAIYGSHPHQAAGGGLRGDDGLTPIQRRTANRMERGQVISTARGQQTAARQEAEKEPKKSDYGYSSGTWLNPGEGPSPDSLEYEAARRKADVNTARAKFEAGMYGFTADSASKAGALEGKGIDPDSPEQQERFGMEKIKTAYGLYTAIMQSAATPEAKREATRLYKQVERETLAAMGRVPLDKTNYDR
jgi:hypothetical protein